MHETGLSNTLPVDERPDSVVSSYELLRLVTSVCISNGRLKMIEKEPKSPRRSSMFLAKSCSLRRRQAPLWTFQSRPRPVNVPRRACVEPTNSITKARTFYYAIYNNRVSHVTQIYHHTHTDGRHIITNSSDSLFVSVFFDESVAIVPDDWLK